MQCHKISYFIFCKIRENLKKDRKENRICDIPSREGLKLNATCDPSRRPESAIQVSCLTYPLVCSSEDKHNTIAGSDDAHIKYIRHVIFTLFLDLKETFLRYFGT